MARARARARVRVRVRVRGGALLVGGERDDLRAQPRHRLHLGAPEKGVGVGLGLWLGLGFGFGLGLGLALGFGSISAHSLSERRSKISTASTLVSLRSTEVASHASPMSGKTMKADALCRWSGTVLYVTRDTKPSVPSEPIINRLTISIGSEGGKSARALIE